MIKTFDLFAGIGGFRLGIENIFRKKNIKTKTVGWSEIDDIVRKHNANFFDNDFLLRYQKNYITR